MRCGTQLETALRSVGPGAGLEELVAKKRSGSTRQGMGLRGTKPAAAAKAGHSEPRGVALVQVEAAGSVDARMQVDLQNVPTPVATFAANAARAHLFGPAAHLPDTQLSPPSQSCTYLQGWPAAAPFSLHLPSMHQGAWPQSSQVVQGAPGLGSPKHLWLSNSSHRMLWHRPSALQSDPSACSSPMHLSSIQPLPLGHGKLDVEHSPFWGWRTGNRALLRLYLADRLRYPPSPNAGHNHATRHSNRQRPY